MAIVSADWLPWVGLGLAAFAIDQVLFGGRYINQMLDTASGNKFDVWTLRPETRFKGRHCGTLKVLGYRNRISNNGIERQTLALGFIDDQGNIHQADADDLEIPPQALKRWYVDNYDIGLRSDRMKEMQSEIDELRYRVATANTKANLAFVNSMDFTTRITASMGEFKKNIGSTVMIAQRTKEGYKMGEEEQKTETMAAEQ
jgi:hypothetical protein